MLPMLRCKRLTRYHSKHGNHVHVRPRLSMLPILSYLQDIVFYLSTVPRFHFFTKRFRPAHVPETSSVVRNTMFLAALMSRFHMIPPKIVAGPDSRSADQTLEKLSNRMDTSGLFISYGKGSIWMTYFLIKSRKSKQGKREFKSMAV